ncbi:MAG: aminotransferase class IV [Candidatus Delongbacteria bacterium]|jgi:branched-subunit amino acid aminotransferase/4-amino-4-deoxychorismate lyase|nr:aminotransferase class IV [Candidatus Delongbacteria bacterium]
MGRKVLFDGVIKYKDSINIRPDSPTLNFGTGLFETVLYEKNRLFFFDDHIERLRSSSEELNLPLPRFDHASENHIKELVSQNGMTDKTVRVKVLYAPLFDEEKWNLLASVSSYERTAGFITATVDMRVRDNYLSRFKTTSYMQNRLSLKNSALNGETLLINGSGQIIEGSRSNLIGIKNNVLYFTGTKESYLQGIMQNNIIRDHKKIGFGGAVGLEGGFCPDELGSYDEIIITNSLIIAKPAEAVNYGNIKYPFSSRKHTDQILSFYIK